MGAAGRVGYAVVGLGHFAERTVLPGFRKSRKAQLVALVSGDERKARRLAKRFGPCDIYNYSTYADCLNHPQVDASAYQWTTEPEVFREVDENMAFRLSFPDGLVMQATASWGGAKQSFLHIVGEEGWATLAPAYQYDEERRIYGRIRGRWFEKEYKVLNELALELDAFADCIRRNREPAPNGAEGLRDVAVMQAIYESAREGRPVKIA